MEKLLTEKEFNSLVRQWGNYVRASSRNLLSSSTHSTSQLQNSLGVFLKNDKVSHAAYKISFKFERYGVFRAYGTGRGYKRVGGSVTRVAPAKVLGGMFDGAIKRKPLNFLDQFIDKDINRLADVVQQYYGDKALKHLLDNFDKFKIDKNG